MERTLRNFVFFLFCFLFIAPAASATGNLQQGSLVEPPAQIVSNPEDKPPGVIDQLKELPNQVTTPINTEKIDRAGEEISLKLGEVEAWVRPILGNWINKELVWGITWFKMFGSLMLLLLVLAMERTLRFVINRWLRRKNVAAEPPSWAAIFARGISKPLSLFIWAYGTYGALSPLFPLLAQQGVPEKIHLGIIWATDVTGSIAALWFCYRLLHLANYQIIRWAGNQHGWIGKMIKGLSERYHSPMKVLILLIFCRLISPLFGFGLLAESLIGQTFGLLLIATITWLTIQTLHVLEEVFLSHYRMDAADNLAARKMHTQVQFLKRMAITLVLVLAGGSMLMLFDKVRQLGTSILASAGIIGIVVGLAAQRSISNILVGLQIALTQPIRLDDVVIVENEWGRIEEITTTYVVVKLWDLRRLIVPTTYFTEKPFQNWTRGSSELLGTVFLYTDYTIPVAMVRERLRLILAESNWWNGKVGEVHVTNTSAQGMELRMLASADNAGAAWDLRCQIREQMVTFLQEQYPQCLPRIRAELQPLSTPEPKVSSQG
ncbi:MAG: mechanosensitive ion channel family protein [Desulfobulbus sp.]